MRVAKISKVLIMERWAAVEGEEVDEKWNVRMNSEELSSTSHSIAK